MTSFVLLTVFVAGMIGLGWEISGRLVRGATTEIAPIERTAYAGAIALMLWLAVAWALAFAHSLSRVPLAICGVVALAIALFRIVPRYRSTDLRATGNVPVELVILSPVVLFTIFLFWKGVVAPVAAPDALSYHMPRAAMIVQSETIKPFDVPEFRINQLPANYELLLATVMSLHGDELTEWISTLVFIHFLIACAALSRQWFGPGMHNAVIVLAAASMPSLLFQGTLHKNDLMVATLIVTGQLALCRWITTPSSTGFLVLLGTCGVAATGTKTQGLAFAGLAAIAVAGFAFRAIRNGSLQLRALIAPVLIAMTLPLLGGWSYVITHQAAEAGASAMASVAPVPYGELANFWLIPALLLIAPFCTTTDFIQLPWNGERWLWGANDPYASHLGAITTFLIIAAPICIWLFRKHSGDVAPRARLVVSAIIFGSLIATFGVKPSIFGYLSGFPRYVLFAMPTVLAWTVAPLFARLASMRRTFALGAASIFVLTAIQAEVNVARFDKFATLSSVLDGSLDPGTRWFAGAAARSTFLTDSIASPNAVIDVYGGHDTWSYPLFGDTYQRNVRFIHNVSEIRADADWVVVDRAYNSFWGHPDFHHIRDYPKYLGRGPRTADDVRVAQQLLRDPHFRLVYAYPPRVQAIFRRVRSAHDAAAR
ncbi:MAG: hypothetical protein ACTHQM_18855 [Thermoanaerobaculia bacterium]